MKIHLYTVCWNEQELLPYFFNHYDFVDQFFIYDNESDDNTHAIIKTHKNAEIITYKTDGTIRDDAYISIKNNAWKNSRGKCDLVIICDLDEFLYHKNLLQFLEDNKNCTLFPAMGFNMVGTTPLCPDRKITEQLTDGYVNHWEDKTILFNPNRIEEINYLPGCHKSNPIGDINILGVSDLKLLHYRLLNWDYYIARVNSFRTRLSPMNKAKGWGLHYLIEEKKYREMYEEWLKIKSRII